MEEHLKFSYHQNIFDPQYLRDVNTEEGRKLVSIFIRPDLLKTIISVKRKI